MAVEIKIGLDEVNACLGKIISSLKFEAKDINVTLILTTHSQLLSTYYPHI